MDPLILIVVVLLILWALGYFVVHVGSLIHLLIVIVIVIVIVRLIRGQRIL